MGTVITHTNGLTPTLPTLADLIEDTEMSLKENKLLFLLNQEPPASWMSSHPTIKVKNSENQFVSLQYLPRERVEWLLIRIFGSYRIEIKSVQVIANSVCVTVRLHVFNPVTGKDEWQDGVGAAPIQTDAGAGAMDWNKAKAGGVQMAAPSAETFAFKDAAEKFGKIFGRDLNSKNEIEYSSLLKQDKEIDVSELTELFEIKKEFLSKADMKNAERILKNQEKASYPKLQKQLAAL